MQLLIKAVSLSAIREFCLLVISRDAATRKLPTRYRQVAATDQLDHEKVKTC